ncbi:MAG: rhomboid family intramembrane serine protease [Mycobacterium leprae]
MAKKPDRDPWPWMTTTLIGVILFIWVVMTIQGRSLNATVTNGALLVRWGAAFRPDLLEQREYWRLFTASFVHIGYLHLAINSWSLWVMGRAVEILYGPWQLLYLFVVTGVAGATTSTLLGAPVVLAAGASGAVMGLVGAVLWFRLSSPLGEVIRWRPLVLTLVLNVGIGLGLYRFVDNWDHMGGLVAGVLAAAVVGVPFVKGEHRPRFTLNRWGRVTLSTLVLATVVALVAGVVDLPGPSRDLNVALDALQQGRMAEAEEGLRVAIKRQPNEPNLHGYLSQAYAMQGKCELAVAELGEIDRLKADFPGLRAWLADRCGE